MELSATELKQRSGQVLDSAQREPVKILKHGRVYGAVISSQDLILLEKARAGERDEQLKSAVQAGFDQIENGQFSTRSMSDLAAEARRRVDAKNKALSL